ncbi:MAG: hypothetical protein U5M23_00625 [Marinagarivorans sp.]|nr:hypothetical protein [Marinagarivorans sp.]
MLETNNIHYQLRNALPQQPASSFSPQGCLVKSLLLKDNQAPSTDFIALGSYFKFRSREYELQPGFACDRCQRTARDIGKSGLSAVPAIPQWNSRTTLVDSSLLEFGTLWLETGDQEQMLEVKRDDFYDMVKTLNIGRICSKEARASRR